MTTMVGVSLRGRPILGVIHRPFSGDTYWAVVGHGRSPNLEGGQNNGDHTHRTRIIVSRSHAGNVANFR